MIAVLLGMNVANLSVFGILGTFFGLFLLAFGFSSLFVMLALRSGDQQTQMAIINLINLPLLFGSNALSPAKFMPDWLQTFVQINPISYGADGVSSIVSKCCGLFKTGYIFASCLQYTMVNCNIKDFNTIRRYLGNTIAPLDYAWTFPKNEYVVNVGVSMRGKPAEQYLRRFVSTHSQFFGNARIIKKMGAPVPVGGQLKELVRGNALIIGDAAGLAKHGFQ